jgi:malate synthase
VTPTIAAAPLAASSSRLAIRADLAAAYADVLTPEVWQALDVLAPFDAKRRQLMHARLTRRAARAQHQERIGFLNPGEIIAGTDILVREARAGAFEGSAIPRDLQRQWIQGTGPATRPRVDRALGLRNIAYALLSGADGWMFDGEDALGQVETMALDSQRNLKLALAQSAQFLTVAREVAAEMNAWARDALGRDIIYDYRHQLGFTTRIFRPRGLHLGDRHIKHADGAEFSASLVDVAMYIVNNHLTLRHEGRSLVLYLPKIQTAEEASLWHAILSVLENHLELDHGAIKTYVLVEQIEASFQLMEIRAALAPRFVGYNTGRWDYINSVADALAWDPTFVHPDIKGLTMTFGYLRAYEERVRAAANTPDRNGRTVLWQGGMEPNIPVGSADGIAHAMHRALAGARREQLAGASGKWVAHWKMVHPLRALWAEVGEANAMGRAVEPLKYDPGAAHALHALDPAPRSVRGARDLLSVALQYVNAALRGHQAAALKPADAFGDDNVLYLMEDLATGEIRLSLLWEWVNKGAVFTEPDAETGIAMGDRLTGQFCARLLEEEYGKLLRAGDRDVHDDSKETTLPIAREIVARYVRFPRKAPWLVDLINLNLDDHDLWRARARIDAYLSAYVRTGRRVVDPRELVLR